MPRTQRHTQQAPTVQTTITMPPPQDAPKDTDKPERPDFWTYMQGLSENDWKEHIVYLTRERPKTSINGLGGYLVKITQPFDMEDIKQAYGGYEFSFIMKKGKDLIYSGRFPVEAPPKFDPAREQTATVPAATSPAQPTDVPGVVNQVMTLLREQLDHERERSGASNPATERALDLLSEASKRAMETVTNQVPKASNATTELRELVAAMKDMGIVGAQHEGSTLGSLVKELSPLITLLTPVLGKFFAPQDLLDQATKFMALLDKVDALRGKGGSGRGRTTTEDLILEGINKLPEVIQSLQREKQPGQPQPIRRLPPPGVAPGSPQPAPRNAAAWPTASAASPLRVTPIHSGTDPAQPAQPAQPPADQQPQAAGPPATAEEFHIAWVKRNIVEMFAMGQDAEKIAVFIDVQKPDLAADLGNYEVSAILGMIAMDPVLSQLAQIPFYELKIEAIRKELIEMAEGDEIEEEEHAEPAPVN